MGKVLMAIASLMLTVNVASAETIWQSAQAVDAAHRTYQYQFYTEVSVICPDWSKAILTRGDAESEICWRNNGSLIEVKKSWGAAADSDFLLKPEGLGSADLSVENLVLLKKASGRSGDLIQKPVKPDELTPACSLLDRRPASSSRNSISFGDPLETQCSQQRSDFGRKLSQGCNLRVKQKYDHFKYDAKVNADIGERVSEFKIIGNTREASLAPRVADAVGKLNLKDGEFGVLGTILDTKTEVGKYNSVNIVSATSRAIICVVDSSYDFVTLAEF